MRRIDPQSEVCQNRRMEKIVAWFREKIKKPIVRERLALMLPCLPFFGMFLVITYFLTGIIYLNLFYCAIILFLIFGSIFKKWHRFDWFYYWLSIAVFFLLWANQFNGFRLTGENFDWWSQTYPYIQLNSKCEIMCYTPLSIPLTLLIISSFIGMAYLVNRYFTEFRKKIFWPILGFSSFYWIVMTPIYLLLIDQNLSYIFRQTPSALFLPHRPLFILFIAALLAIHSKKKSGSRFFIIGIAFFHLFFLIMNASILSVIKTNVGYSINFGEVFYSNSLNLMTLFRNYTDIFWVRPVFFCNAFLLSSLLFLAIRKTWRKWRQKPNKTLSGILLWIPGSLACIYIGMIFLFPTNIAYKFEGLIPSFLSESYDKPRSNWFFYGFYAILIGILLIQLIRWLIPVARSPNLSSGLFQSLRSKAMEIICILISTGVLIYSFTGFRVTQADWELTKAVHDSDLGSVEQAIEKGADPFVRYDGGNLLHLAIWSDDPAVLNFLLEKGLDPNQKNLRGEIPILELMNIENWFSDNSEATEKKVKFLIEKGAEFDLSFTSFLSRQHLLPIFFEICSDKKRIREIINRQDENGSTELHKAVIEGDFESIKILLAYGADPSIRDNEGKIPADLAEGKHKEEILELLKNSSITPALLKNKSKE